MGRFRGIPTNIEWLSCVVVACTIFIWHGVNAYMHIFFVYDFDEDEVAEWLRRWTENLMCTARWVGFRLSVGKSLGHPRICVLNYRHQLKL